LCKHARGVTAVALCSLASYPQKPSPKRSESLLRPAAMLSRLFRRRRNTHIDPLEGQNNILAVDVISANSIGEFEPRQGGAPRGEGSHNLLRLISRPRAHDTVNRVSNAVQLVEALRRVEGVSNSSRRGAGHGQPLQIFVALALRELDELIDRMSYDELLQAFGGKNDFLLYTPFAFSFFLFS